MTDYQYTLLVFAVRAFILGAAAALAAKFIL
jgi:hypothetical protein